MKKLYSIDITPDFILPEKEDILNLKNLITKQLSLFEKLIDLKGEVICLTKNQDDIEFKDLFHDFIYFVLTKSYKSFRASLLLAENFLQEDSQIIIRTIYENYLAIKFVTKSPLEIIHFTYKALGVSTNLISHPVGKNGRLQKNKIINPANGEIEDFGLPITKMAESLESEHEIALHKSFYSYLSEYIHLNMIASGNYRNKENNKYIFDSHNGYYNPFVYQGYLIVLFIDYLTIDAGISNQKLATKMFNQNKKIKKELIKILNEFNKENSQMDIVNNMISRIEEEKKLKKIGSNSPN